jgi:hypothetical protein
MDDIEDTPEFRAHVALWEWLEWLAEYMRAEALLALEAAQRIAPGQ